MTSPTSGRVLSRCCGVAVVVALFGELCAPPDAAWASPQQAAATATASPREVPAAARAGRQGMRRDAAEDRRVTAELLRAACRNDPAQLRMLLDRGVSVERRSRDGHSPLSRAASCGRVPSLRVLLDAGAVVDGLGASSKTALGWAAAGGHCNAVALLLAAGADPLAGTAGKTAVDLSFGAAHLRCLDLLLGAVSAARRPVLQDSLLLRATAVRDDERVAGLLQLGVGPELSAGSSRSPLALAVDARDDEVVALLSAAGADWKRAGAPAEARRAELARRGADLTLLHEGRDADIRDEDGRTALIRATRSGNLVAMRLLLARGARVDGDAPSRANDAGNDAGWTPLMEAAASGQAQALALLLGAGADVHRANASGRTALHAAVWFGRDDAVSRLLAAGADPAVEDTFGQSATRLASAAGRPSIAQLLGVPVRFVAPPVGGAKAVRKKTTASPTSSSASSQAGKP